MSTKRVRIFWRPHTTLNVDGANWTTSRRTTVTIRGHSGPVLHSKRDPLSGPDGREPGPNEPADRRDRTPENRKNSMPW